MSLKFILILAIIISFFIETTLIAFPLVYIFALVLFILYPDIRSILIGFLAGIILDSLKLSTIGITSAFILASFALISFINRVFELKDYRMILLLLFVLSFIFGRIFSYTDNLLLYLGVFAISGFAIFYFGKQKIWLK